MPNFLEASALQTALTHIGIPAAVVVVLLMCVTHADKILRGVLFVLTFVNRRFRPAYAARKVSHQASAYINDHILRRVVDTPPVNLKVEFVEGPHDAKLTADWSMFVRIRDERDQTRNILNALAATIPKLFYPHARPYLSPALVKGVDLQFLRTLARLLGSHAEQVFATDFLTPATATDPNLTPLVRILFDIEQGGLFEAILVQELIHLSDHSLLAPPGAPIMDDALRFVDWLRRVATREPGDETNPLQFIGVGFRVAIVLTSKSITQERGTGPYEKAVSIDLARGAESIYILGVRPEQHRFADDIARACVNDRRIELKKTTNVDVRRANSKTNVPLILLAHNKLYASIRTFIERIADLDIVEGSTVIGTVHHVDVSAVRVDVQGLEGILDRRQLAWGFGGDPSLLLNTDDVSEFSVKRIDQEMGVIALSWKSLSTDPWAANLIPPIGTDLEVELVTIESDEWIVRFPSIRLNRTVPAAESAVDTAALALLPADSGSVDAGVDNGVEVDSVVQPPKDLYGRLPHSEWAWSLPNVDGYVPPESGLRFPARVLEHDRTSDRIVVSRREAENSGAAWENARVRFPVGERFRGTVMIVEPDGLVIRLTEGIYGRIAAYKLERLGDELADFQQSVMPGQQFDVIITKARPGRRSFVLDLARGKDKPKSVSTGKPGRKQGRKPR
jgi:hypothetical protein